MKAIGGKVTAVNLSTVQEMNGKVLFGIAIYLSIYLSNITSIVEPPNHKSDWSIWPVKVMDVGGFGCHMISSCRLIGLYDFDHLTTLPRSF